MTRVSIIQSNYIPWRGYFDLIASCDAFVLLDDVQFTRRDWRNRNQIKTRSGLKWLTVPVLSKGLYTQLIRDTLIDGSEWQVSHWSSLTANYSKAPYFEVTAEWLKPIYQDEEWSMISQLNHTLIRTVCGLLGIETQVLSSSEFHLPKDRNERLAGICTQLGADQYVSGPAAKHYLDEGVFNKRGIQISWFDYSGYPEYPQLWGEFVPNVSVLDLLFNCGPHAAEYVPHAKRP